MPRLSVLFVLLAIATCTYASIRFTDIVIDILTWNPLPIKNSSTCPLSIVGRKCDSGNEFYYFDCCGVLDMVCCFKLQDWVLLCLFIAAVIGTIILYHIAQCLNSRGRINRGYSIINQ